MASILSGHTGTLPVAPSRRIAAGLSVGTNANTEPLVFADHAPDAKRRLSMIRKSAKRFSDKIMLKQKSKVRLLSRFGPAPDVRVSLDQKPWNKRFRSKSRAKTRAGGARKNS